MCPSTATTSTTSAFADWPPDPSDLRVVFAGPDVVTSLPHTARQDFQEAHMAARELPYPVFDADNHFYEPKEALTQFLPDNRKGVIDYIDIKGRTKIMVRNVVSDYIPNPTFEVVARPGRPGGVLPARQRRQELPRGDGQADEGHPRIPQPRGPPRGDGCARPRLHADVPDAGQPRRGAAQGRSRPDPRHRSRAERVDV